MRVTGTLLAATVAVLGSAAPARAQERHAHAGPRGDAGLGSVAFANSGNAASQAPFLRGLALLHSFEYDQAGEAFRAAQQADGGFAMAFWGEALTYAHLLWGEDDIVAARAALTRLAAGREARLAKAATPRERAYGTAIEALVGDGDVPARVSGFGAAMRGLTTAHPDDLDAAAFTALALLFGYYAGDLPPDQRRAAREDAIAFAQRVFSANPQHPGGAHYLIHAADDPELAPRGLDAARRYAAIAPDSEHALHMPSHIFVQLGLWEDAIASNERAWSASRQDIAARKLSGADLSFHSLEWLQYGYLQRGRYRDARATIATAREVLTGVDLAAAQHVDARYTIGRLAFQYAAATGDWSGEICRDRGESAPAIGAAADRDRSMRAIAFYQSTIAAARCGRGANTLPAVQSRLDALPATDPARVLPQMTLWHAGLLSYLDGHFSGNVETLLADPVPPSRAPLGPPPTLRSEELIGHARVKAGRLKDAVAAYERAFQLTPNRSAVLLGLARARRAAGDATGSADAYRRLLANWRDADPTVPELQEVRDGAATRP